MSIAGIQGGDSARRPESGVPNGNPVSNMFTELLVAQIKHQDPLAPMEASQFVTQFAQLSQVQAMETMASLTSATAALQESMLVVNLATQVGSDVMVATDALHLGGEPAPIGFVLESHSSETTAVFTDSAGREFRVPLGPFDAGETEVPIDPAAHGLPHGKYTLKLETSSGEQPRIEVKGRLQGVRLDGNGGVVLNVSGIGDVTTADISRFLGKANAPADFIPAGLF